MRLAGFVAIFLVFIVVGAGFQGERVTGWIAAWLGELDPLVEPRWFGISLLEMTIMVAVSGFAAWLLWRGFRR